MLKTRSFAIPAIAAIACGVLLFAAIPNRAADDVKIKPATKTADASKPSTHKVVGEQFRVTAEVSGVFEASQTAEVIVRPKVWQTLKVVKAVEPGTQVATGDRLVWLETDKIDEAIRDASHAAELSKLALKQAQAEFDAFQKTFPMDMENAKRTRDQAVDDYGHFLKIDLPLSKKSAEFSVKMSEGSLENAMEELKQLEKMYKADDLTEETEEIVLKRARRTVETAQHFLNSSRARNERTINATLPRRKQSMDDATARARYNYDTLKITLPLQATVKRLGLEKAQRDHDKVLEKLAELKADRQLLTVRAPTAGIVYYGSFNRGKWSGAATVDKQLQPNGTLSAGSVFITIVKPRPVTVRIDVPEKSLANVVAGAKATVIATAQPDVKAPGRVKSVSRIPIAAGTFDGVVELTGDGLATAIVPGMTCKVKITAYDKQNAVVVPASAVFTDDGADSHVYIQRGAGSFKRPVKTGRKSGKKIEILEGLKPGDTILASKPKK